MKRRGWIALAALLALLLGMSTAATLLLTSERGLLLALQFAQRALPGELRWGAASGRLIGPLTLENVSYRDTRGEYRSARVHLDWSPGRLLARRLSVHALHLDAVEIAIADPARESDATPVEPGWTLPLELVVRDLAVNGLRVRRGAQAPIAVDSVKLAVASGLEWLDVQAFALHMPQGELRAQGRIGLGRDVASDLALDWRASPPGYAPLAAQGRIAGTWELLQIEQTFTAPQPAQLRMSIEQPFTALRWDGELTLPELALRTLQAEWPDLRISATLRAGGTLEDYRLELAADAAGAELPPAALNATAQGDRHGLRIEALRMRALDGTIQGKGEVAWSPALRWEMRAQVEGIDPGRHWPDWPGRLSAQMNARGAHTEQRLALDARIDALAGELRGYPVRGSGALALEDGRMRLDSVRIQSGDARLAADGAVDAQWDVRWQVQAPQVRQLLPGYAGAASASGTLSGARATPRLRAQVELRDIAAEDVRIAELRLDADASLRPQAPLHVTARGKALRIAERRFDTLDIDLEGRLEQHAFHMQAQGAEQAVRLDARGGWNDRQWRGSVERADWRIPETGEWRLGRPVSLRLAARQGVMERACWEQTTARLCAQFDYDARERRLQADLTDWPLASLRERLPPEVHIEGATLAARLNARQPAAGDTQATARVELTPGTVSWDEQVWRQQTVFGGGDMQLNLGASGLHGEMQMRLSGTDRLSARMALPGYTFGADPAQQRLDASLQGEMRDLTLLSGLVEEVDNVSGRLSLDAVLAGTLAAPRMQGHFSLNEGRMFIGAAGVQLQDVQMTLGNDVDAAPGGGGLRLRGGARSGPGQLRLEGYIAGAGYDTGLQAEVRLSGQDFEAVNLPEARVLATPDLRAALHGRTLDLSGGVDIPEARFEPRDTRGTVMPSRDVVRLDEQAERIPPDWRVNSRVRVNLGERVSFNGYGLSGRLTGALDIVDEAGKQPRASGELEVKDGVYAAYGQELKIERGRVLYRDSPLDNPGVDVRATRRSGDVLAGVRILGTAQQPQAELYSQPSLPQADVLSYLLLGQPVASASGSEGEMLYKAASSLGLRGGNQLAQSIGSRFGLDQVSLGGSDLQGAALTVGKYLAPRLYLNYSIGLLDAANKLQLRYQLTKRLSVQTETGAAAGGDILYTIER